MIGRRYGRLAVEAFDHYGDGQSWWRCRCDCGGSKVVGLKCLNNGKTRSCGCLSTGRKGHPGWRRRAKLTPRQEAWLRAHYMHTRNADIIARLGLTESSLHRLARALGLKKSAQFMHKAQARAAELAKQSHVANGTYPPKGYRIPRSEEFCFKPGHKESERTKKARIEKSAESRRRTVKLERARILFGMEQQTRMKLIAGPRALCSLRGYLRKHGYEVPRGGHVAYYDENTRRCPKIEARRRGEPHYFYIEYLPKPHAV